MAVCVAVWDIYTLSSYSIAMALAALCLSTSLRALSLVTILGAVVLG
jgi:hypothetical protein